MKPGHSRPKVQNILNECVNLVIFEGLCGLVVSHTGIVTAWRSLLMFAVRNGLKTFLHRRENEGTSSCILWHVFVRPNFLESRCFAMLTRVVLSGVFSVVFFAPLGLSNTFSSQILITGVKSTPILYVCFATCCPPTTSNLYRSPSFYLRFAGEQGGVKRDPRGEDTSPRRVFEGGSDTVQFVPGTLRHSPTPPIFNCEDKPVSYSGAWVKREPSENKGRGSVKLEGGKRDVGGSDTEGSDALRSKKSKKRKPRRKQSSFEEGDVSQTRLVGERDVNHSANGSATSSVLAVKPVREQGGSNSASDVGGSSSERKLHMKPSSQMIAVKSAQASGGHGGNNSSGGFDEKKVPAETGDAAANRGSDTRRAKYPPPVNAGMTPSRKAPSRSTRVIRPRHSRRDSGADTEILTYVKHERAIQDDGDSGSEGCRFAAPELEGEDVLCAAGGSHAPFQRRKKRPRPKLDEKGRGLEGSARALVWGESCPACRERSLAKAMVKEAEEGAVVSRQCFAGPCRGPEGQGFTGEGPVRPGQYVFLRNAPPEEVQRSLVSEGEFAAPRPGGLFGDDLAGTRIRVWRTQGSRGVGDDSRGFDSRGLFAEADVVKFDPATRKHRVRFVEDGTVEDLRLIEPGGANGRVRWLQRRARARARDGIRRNANGLCEGPCGEAGGLLGDEHDPPAQRRENWRWAMGRWRWGIGEREGYGAGGRGLGARTKDNNDKCESAWFASCGDGMFPPIGRVLAVERRYLDTGGRVRKGDEVTRAGGKGRASEVFLKIARLWYPQDTRHGMDPFVHGKAEVFEACIAMHGTGQDGTAKCAIRDGLAPAAAVGSGAAVLRLDDERQIDPTLKLEPVVQWVRACDAWRAASVHQCIDGRLNPCAGKVVNDPFQPQAEFFLSHRYCLELDAYFPLESNKGPALPEKDGGGDGDAPGEGGDDVGGDSGVGVNHSPRSSKGRLLLRENSDGASHLPPKWHPLKKRMSMDKASPLVAMTGGEGSAVGLRDSGVIGWESVIRRCDGGSGGRASASSLTPSYGGGTTRKRSRSSEEIFLCHRCRHAFPSQRLRSCLANGCGKRFCLPCREGKEEASFRGSKVGLEASTGIRENGGESGEKGWTTPLPWIGLCCRGLCGCQECGANADSGLVASWQARNGLPSFATAGGEGGGGGRLLTAAKESQEWREPVMKKSEESVAAEWSGWQVMRREPKVEPKAGQAKASGDGDTRVGRREGDHGIDAGQEGEAEAEDDTEKEESDGVVEWCKSCSGPGPRGSLTRCYYCHGGVHADECRGFEEALIKRRLDEYGIGPSGRLMAPPKGEGAVGHGVAVFVHGRWRAGLVLCWSPILGAHYLRYLDEVVAGDDGAPAPELDAVPWDGEWVMLLASADKVRRCAGRSGTSGGNRPAVAEASAVRWILLEVTLRLFPPPVTASTGAGAGNAGTPARSVVAPKTPPHPPESKPAIRVLRGLLKRRFEITRAAAGPKSIESVKYHPPAVVLPSGISGVVGVGERGIDERPKVGNPPWVCLKCVEYKLRRLQRRVRLQFQAPREDWEAGVEAQVQAQMVAKEASQRGSYYLAPTVQNEVCCTTGIVAAPSPPPPAVAKDGVSSVAGWMKPVKIIHEPVPHPVDKVPGVSSNSNCSITLLEANSVDGRAADTPVAAGDAQSGGQCVGQSPHESGGIRPAVLTGARPVVVAERAADPENSVDFENEVDAAGAEEQRRQELRRARADRRLRWLPVGTDPQGARPFAYEAGFMSDLSDLHAHGGVTATGARVSASRQRLFRGKKRPITPVMSRVFSHLLSGLDAQRPLVFALPLEITRLDGDMLAFFAGRDVSGEDDGNSVGLVEDALRDVRSVVIVDGTVAALTADIQRPGRPSQEEDGDGGIDQASLSSRLLRVPEAFSLANEVDLESSARVRPLAGNDKQRKMRSSGPGGE